MSLSLGFMCECKHPVKITWKVRFGQMDLAKGEKMKSTLRLGLGTIYVVPFVEKLILLEYMFRV